MGVTLSTYLLFLAAVALLVLTPGPTMLMCMTNAVHHGARQAMVSVVGSITAALTIMLLAALGAGAVLAASETAFTALKVVGSLYLIWLGVQTFRSQGRGLQLDGLQADGHLTHRSPRSLYVQGLLVGGSNPKAILFASAFFPQFIDAGQAFAPQFAVLALTFVAIECTVLTVCALSVGRIAPWLRLPHRVQWFNRVCGGLFAAMGGLLLLARRQA